GFALIVAFLGWVLVVGAMRYLDAARSRRTQLAATLAGCAAFCVGASFDWLWEIAVIPIAFLLLASVLISAGDRPRRSPLPLRISRGAGGLGVAAMVASALPLSATASIRDSQRQAAAADLTAALNSAREAHSVEPFAAEPRVQEALVLEAQGRLDEAASAIAEANRLEPDEWRAWVVRSRLEAERGNATAAVAAYRQARSLNPPSPLFES